MSIVLKYILRTVWKNRIAGLLIIISLSVSTAMVYLNLNIHNDLLEVSRSLFDSMYGGYDICVSGDDISLAAQEFEGCQLLPIQNSGGQYYSEYRETAAAVICCNTSCLDASERGLITVEEGSLPEKQYEIGISRKKAAYYNLSIGDRLSLITDNGTVEYEITCIFSALGIFADERREVIEFLGGFEEENHANTVFVDVKKGNDADALAEKLSANHGEWTVSLTNENAAAGNKVEKIRRILYMMIAMSVLMGYYVISSVTTLLMDARLPVIGTFRSVGASRRKMNMMLLAENVIYGIVSGAAGILLGELLRYLLTAVYYKAEDAAHNISILFVLIGFGFAVVLQIGITLSSLLRTSKRSIKESIFNTSATAYEISPALFPIGAASAAGAALLHVFNYSYGFWQNIIALTLAVLGCICMIPSIVKFAAEGSARRSMSKGKGTVFLALKNMYASKIDVSSVILTAAVTALAMIIFLCTASVSNFFDSYANNYPYDIFIKGLNQPAEEYGFLADMSGVDETVTERWDYSHVLLNGSETRICMVRRGGYSNGITAEDGAEASLKDGYVLIDELLASRLRIKAGEEIEIVNDGQTRTFIIDGYCDSGVFDSDRDCIIMTEADYDAFVELSPALIGIRLADDASIDDMLSDFASEIFEKTGENASVYSKNAYISSELDKTRDALAVFSVIPAFTVFLAILGLVNNQIIAYNRKRREYAVLYSVAMNRAQLGRMVVLEMMVIFFFGSIYGVLMSLWLIRIVRDILFGLISYVEISYDFVKIGLIITAAFAILCLTALIPGRLAKKTNVVEEIKYE